MTSSIHLGIDLGGTKTEVVALDGRGHCLLREREATAGDYEGIVSGIAKLVAMAEQRTGPAATVGIGTPGAISPATGRMKNSNSTVLNGRPLKQDIELAIGRPIRMANDADCFALSEALDGAGAGYDTMFGVIVGTGCGGGIVVNGRALSGPNAIAGEWGHNPLPWPAEGDLPAPPCYCGRYGCIETYLSGPALANDYRRTSGVDRSTREIAARAAFGESAATATLERYADRMARGLASVINILDPGVIVLGGGMSNVEALYRMVPARWGRYVFSDRVDTALCRARHGDSSGVRGAAWLGTEPAPVPGPDR